MPNKQEMEQLLNYAEKNGYAHDTESWSDEAKLAYYQKCQAYEPGEE